MKEKITKLARGIDPEVPAFTISPAAVEMSIEAGEGGSFVIGIISSNGIAVKGICISDDVRIRPASSVFSGRINYITVNVDTKGLFGENIIDGSLKFITDGGEREIPYNIYIPAAGESLYPDGESDIRDNPLIFDYDTPCRGEAGKDSDKDYKFPEDDTAFEELLSGLIRNQDVSGYAFSAYREGIKRDLRITGLYEGYMLSRPDDCEEEIPRAVILYFYFDGDIARAIAEKLYYGILSFEDPSSEMTIGFAPRMSAFAVNNVLESRINKRLRLIYERMLCREIVDQKTAAKLPDILKCAEISLTKGHADYLLITHPEFKVRIKARLIGDRALVPAYFEGSRIDFFSETDNGTGEKPEAPSGEADGSALGKCVNHRVKYVKKNLFNKPDLLIGCFELDPGHEMLLLSACREISFAGITSSADREILLKGLRDGNFEESLRVRMVRALSESEGDMGWLRFLRDEDYNEDSLKYLLAAFLKVGDIDSAYTVIKRYGAEFADLNLLRELFDTLAARRSDKLKTDLDFIRLGVYLFNTGYASDELIGFLCSSYTGGIREMLKLNDCATAKGIDTGDLAERILGFELFADSDERMDEVFGAFLKFPEKDELIMAAYFQKRCSDYFLYAEPVDEPTLFSALFDYLKSRNDPLRAPTACLAALTLYFADKGSLTEDEAALCQLIVDEFIDEGLIFRHFKRLKRRIRIPEEITWKYYIEYRVPKGSAETPRLMLRILPDDTEYHTEEMRRVYKNIFIAETVLFAGDKLEYRIYPSYESREVADQGSINVVKEHKTNNDRMKNVDFIISAINSRDRELLRESMLKYVKNTETMRILFDPENE